jgi:Mg-chelatase subunit ChlI
LNTYLARQRDASHVKDSAYQDLEQRMEDQVAALRGQLEDKDDEIQALENLLEKHRLRRLSRKSEKESLEYDNINIFLRIYIYISGNICYFLFINTSN